MGKLMEELLFGHVGRRNNTTLYNNKIFFESIDSADVETILVASKWISFNFHDGRCTSAVINGKLVSRC